MLFNIKKLSNHKSIWRHAKDHIRRFKHLKKINLIETAFFAFEIDVEFTQKVMSGVKPYQLI
jgi:hypothetical protein